MFQIITTEATKCIFISGGFQELILWLFGLPWKCIFSIIYFWTPIYAILEIQKTIKIISVLKLLKS